LRNVIWSFSLNLTFLVCQVEREGPVLAFLQGISPLLDTLSLQLSNKRQRQSAQTTRLLTEDSRSSSQKA
jgi:hypothetical protein